LGVGADLVSEKALVSGDAESITQTARLLVDAVREARQGPL